MNHVYFETIDSGDTFSNLGLQSLIIRFFYVSSAVSGSRGGSQHTQRRTQEKAARAGPHGGYLENVITWPQHRPHHGIKKPLETDNVAGVEL